MKSMHPENNFTDQAITMSIGSWSRGIDQELRFWSHWISSKGAQWNHEFVDRLNVEKVIDGKLAEILKSKSGPIKILDVGAGPLTSVGKKFPDKLVVVEATDPLAEFYSIFLKRENLTPPVETKFSTAEDLSVFYDESSFDVVHCRNALDHSFDPVRSINEMLRITKVGGAILLDHHENEAEGENYSGFHQYNFTEEGGKFVIWNKSNKTIINDMLPIKASVYTTKIGENIEVVIEKNEEFRDIQGNSRHRDRAAILLKSLINYYGYESMSNLKQGGEK